MAQTSDYATSEQRVRRAYRRRTWLINHLLIFVALNAAIWLHYLSFALRADVFHVNALMDRVIVTLVWVMLLAAHWVNARQAAALEREIDHLHQQDLQAQDLRQETDPDAKPKRIDPETLARLADLDDADDAYLPLDALLAAPPETDSTP